MMNELNHEDCIFCNIESSRKIDEDDLFYVIRDGFPVTALHTLIIPNRHVETYFELTEDEVLVGFMRTEKFHLSLSYTSNTKTKG